MVHISYSFRIHDLGATGKRQMGPFLDLGPPALGLAVDRKID